MQDIPFDRNAWRIVIRRNVVKQNRKRFVILMKVNPDCEAKSVGGKSLCRKESVVRSGFDKVVKIGLREL